ncbi:hypothetical protein S14_47 [Shewanella sp. phage 1/4]|uniref:hypothetical protein n=1 Tax=Shewanella phage 1/4 TaxID=1458859 RepID=UPI0004F6480D|nr:hypothetical protein S14_47 [Shewanella sp. phage 1/4]AHK11159.1 hypothetical protein S14_47 [Shewanella sp. phage 1/4]
MSGIFKLPMICEDGDGYIYSQDCRHSIKFDDTDTNCLEQKTFVANAINSHDKLTEQNKMLREALVLADSWLKIDPMYHASPVCETVIKALEATK